MSWLTILIQFIERLIEQCQDAKPEDVVREARNEDSDVRRGVLLKASRQAIAAGELTRKQAKKARRAAVKRVRQSTDKQLGMWASTCRAPLQ